MRLLRLKRSYTPLTRERNPTQYSVRSSVHSHAQHNLSSLIKKVCRVHRGTTRSLDARVCDDRRQRRAHRATCGIHELMRVFVGVPSVDDVSVLSSPTSSSPSRTRESTSTALPACSCSLAPAVLVRRSLPGTDIIERFPNKVMNAHTTQHNTTLYRT